MLIRYLGPAKEIRFKRGPRFVEFEAGGPPVEVEEEFGAELLGKNPDGLTVEQVIGYGVPVFEAVVGRAPLPAPAGGEEVDG